MWLRYPILFVTLSGELKRQEKIGNASYMVDFMIEFLGDYYATVKALHIIFVIYWMAGLLMIPRFFVYHHAVLPDSKEHLQWIEREKRLFKIILNPAMILSLIFGLLMMAVGDFLSDGWFHGKLLLVILMMAFHMMMARYRKIFARGERPKSEKYFRMINEIPSLLIIGIVLLVIVKPFT